MSLFSREVLAVIQHPTFYSPAYQHYGQNPALNVICDQCKTPNLLLAFGYEKHDLCFSCFEFIYKQLTLGNVSASATSVQNVRHHPPPPMGPKPPEDERPRSTPQSKFQFGVSRQSGTAIDCQSSTAPREQPKFSFGSPATMTFEQANTDEVEVDQAAVL